MSQGSAWIAVHRLVVERDVRFPAPPRSPAWPRPPARRGRRAACPWRSSVRSAAAAVVGADQLQLQHAGDGGGGGRERRLTRSRVTSSLPPSSEGLVVTRSRHRPVSEVGRTLRADRPEARGRYRRTRRSDSAQGRAPLARAWLAVAAVLVASAAVGTPMLSVPPATAPSTTTSTAPPSTTTRRRGSAPRHPMGLVPHAPPPAPMHSEWTSASPTPPGRSPGSGPRRFRPPVSDVLQAAITEAPADESRSTWQLGCPVTLEQLRYVTVSFFGFARVSSPASCW